MPCVATEQLYILQAILQPSAAVADPRHSKSNDRWPVWRTVLVPANFSLFQLHVVLQECFPWREDEFASHRYYHDSTMVDGDALKIHKAVPERSLTSYQIVVPCEADGFVMEIAPGVFIEHSHPHEPLPSFSVGMNENVDFPNDQITLRILRDERVYRLEDVFTATTGPYSSMVYEFDDGTGSNRERILIKLANAISSSHPSLGGDSKTPRIVASSNQDTDAIQSRLARAHLSSSSPHSHVTRCYMCSRYPDFCRTDTFGRCSAFTDITGSACCEHCLVHPYQLHIRASLEEHVHEAWEHGKEILVTERRRFVETERRRRGDQEGASEESNVGDDVVMEEVLEQGHAWCGWREFGGDRCVYCS